VEEKKKLSQRDFIIAILMIFLLSGFSFWHFKNWKKSISEFKPPKIEIPKPELFPKKEGHKEWISPDGKLKLEYSADWIEINKKILEEFPKEKIKESEVLFVAQKFKLERVAQAFLLVERLNFPEKSFDEILEIMQKNVSERNIEMQILNQEKKEKEWILEVLYKRKDGFSLHSKEKLLRIGNGIFLISFFTFEPYWLDFKEEGEKILRSVQYLQ
jgi:hypothetical protein